MEQNTPMADGVMSWDLVARLQAALDSGGPVLLVIVGLSILALAIVLVKLTQFAWLGLWSSGFITEALTACHAGRPDLSLAILSGRRHPVAWVMERAIHGKREGRWVRSDLAEDLAREGAARRGELRSFLGQLELIANLAPLLGLLGTVLGMIDAFRALEEAGRQVDPAVLSGGIWVALLTTAAGLIVAIPATAALHLLDGEVERVERLLDDAVTQILVSPTFPAPRATAAQAQPALGTAGQEA